MFFSAAVRSSEPLTHAVICFQNEPEPTAAGMASEASNPKPVDTLASNCLIGHGSSTGRGSFFRYWSTTSAS